MKVTIENYTGHCLKTWGGENQKERAKLGIIGELGEVAEVLKKFLRGDFDKVERDKRLLKELGDTGYYIAIDLKLAGFDIKDIIDYQNKVDYVSVFDLAFYFTEYMENENVRTANSHVMCFVQLVEYYGFTIEQVMQANIEKLADRAERNKISGDGDER